MVIIFFGAPTANADAIEDYAVQLLEKNHFEGKVKVIEGNSYYDNETGFGYANYDDHIENKNPNVLYPSASLQKIATGAMIVQLITESQKTNNPITQYTQISRWFPELKGSNTITVGQLLTQTSGIIDPDTENYNGPIMSEEEAVDNCVKRINKIGLSNQGTFQYNNDNYILLAGIIRKYTGKSYNENLNQRIIKPLNLVNTYMWDNLPKNIIKAVSYNYIEGKNYQNARLPKDNLMSYIVGAGNMYTTPNDYYKLQRGLYNGYILNQSDFDYLTNLKSKPNNSDYSGGMYIQNLKTNSGKKYKMVYGSLNHASYSNWVKLTLDNNTGVILFLNQTPQTGVATQVKKIGQQIMDYTENYNPPCTECDYYLTIMNNDAPLYSDIKLGKIKQNSQKLYQRTYHAKRYYMINGKKYYSLYDNNDKWMGYINEIYLSDSAKHDKGGEYIKYNKYISITKDNYTIWNNFNFSKKRNNTKNLYQKTYLAKGYYNHFNGSRYLSLYDENNNWIGYLNEKATQIGYNNGINPCGKHFKYNKYISITQNNYTIWNDFNFSKRRNNTKNLYQKTYLAKGYYNHFNGYCYLSLYDSNNNWIGYLNRNATQIGYKDGNTPGGKAFDIKKYGVIIRKNYPIWSDFDYKKQRGTTSDNIGITVYIPRKYNHFDGRTYYSIYDANNHDKWLGYIDEKAIRLK